MRKPRKIALLGAVCHDSIIALDGGVGQSFGGILYNAAAFASLLDDGDLLVPITKIGRDRFEAAVDEFSKLPHVSHEFITRCDEPTIEVMLEWTSESSRNETIMNRMPRYTIDELRPALDCDAVHLNFIHGTEIDLDTLSEFRNSYSGLMSLDVHQAISRFDAHGKRTIAGLPDWKQWTAQFDLVQCNDFELRAMLSLSESDDLESAAKRICATGPAIAVVTLGPDGCLLVYESAGSYRTLTLPAFHAGPIEDTTGCGDSFSAGMLLGLLEGHDPATSAACGVIVAGVNAMYSGLGDLSAARPFLENPRSHFPRD